MDIQNTLYSERVYLEREKEELKAKAKSLKSEIELIELQINELKSTCQHSLVLTLDDHIPHKIGRIVINVCPTCMKEEYTYRGNERENTCFKDSKVIDLTKYHIEDVKRDIPKICEYIHENSDIFSSDEFSTIELAKLIIEYLENVKHKKRVKRIGTKEKAQ